MSQIPSDNDRRIARLEAEVRVLRREMAALRGALGGAPVASSAESASRVAAGEPARASPTSATTAEREVGAGSVENGRAAAAPDRVAPDTAEQIAAAVRERLAARRELVAKPQPARPLEALVGRYLTLGIGVLTVLFGVGTFLAWAIAHGWLGPTVRVGLGFLGAAGLAAFGLRVRASGTREFGNVLIALALAVTEVVCWYAGPVLHVIPSFAALGVALVASAVLVEFALRHEEASLCTVGFGGAALAPFLANQVASPFVLATYGLLVITLSTVALGDRPWRGPRLVPLLSIFWYSIVLLSVSRPLFGAEVVFGTVAWLRNALPLLFPCAVLAGVIPGASAAHRRMLIRAAGGALILGAVALTSRAHGTVELAIFVAASLVTLAFLDLTKEVEESSADASISGQATFDAALLPMVLLGAALGLTSGRETLAAGIALAWSAGGFFATSRSRGEPEAEPWASTATLSLLLVPAALEIAGLANIGMVLVGVAVILAVADLRLPRSTFLVASLLVLYAASSVAWIALSESPLGVAARFLPRPNAAAALALVGWAIVTKVFATPRDFSDETPFGRAVRGPAGVAAPVAMVSGLVAAFFFVRADLITAFSRPTITSLLILYYGSVGVITIAVGRRIDSQPARLVGLALTLFAAGKVLLEALAVPNVAVRVALFFAVSAFLIGVAYWYRRDASSEDAMPTLRSTARS